MKNTLKIISSSAIAFLYCGCAFWNQPADTQLANYTKIITSATQIGATIDLRTHPEHRAAYEASLQALNSLSGSANYDPVKLMDALKQLPIKEFKGTSGAWNVTPQDVVLAWDAVTTLFITPDKTPPWVKATLGGVTAGLVKALAASPAELEKTAQKVTVSVPLSAQ